MGAVHSREIDTPHPTPSVDPRSPCPQIIRTPLQVVLDKDDPRSPSTNVLRTPIDKQFTEQSSAEANDENRGGRCPLLKQPVQVEKKSLLKEFNN